MSLFCTDRSSGEFGARIFSHYCNLPYKYRLFNGIIIYKWWISHFHCHLSTKFPRFWSKMDGLMLRSSATSPTVSQRLSSKAFFTVVRVLAEPMVLQICRWNSLFIIFPSISLGRNSDPVFGSRCQARPTSSERLPAPRSWDRWWRPQAMCHRRT